MFNKRWFQILVFFILVFLLILLIAATNFIFDPLVKYLGAVIVPFIGAGILYYLTKPLMHLFEKCKINRLFSVLLVFIVLLLFAFFIVRYVGPIAQYQFNNLIGNMPKMIHWAQDIIVDVQSSQIAIPEQLDDAINNFTDNLQGYAENILNYLFGVVGQLIGFITSIILVPFFLFFMLKDGEKFIPFITRIFSKKKAANIHSLLSKMDETLTSYIQGQMMVSFILGILLFISYLIIGLNYSLTLALFAMLMNVIPFLGPFIAVTPALIVGAFQDPIMILWVAIITLIVQQVESNVLSPAVMGKSLDLHPLTVITVILAAGSIAGFIGILFAVPFYAVIKTIIVHFYQTYEKSKENKEDALI
ncbi:putative PurR-regulated permease PerM [Virgibacillus halotolerans]|uniref:AI-2E family transporter n=1 Tax=Virgibacillus halotolerans TaxID=1071053 RepID=UPI00196159FD|nr:AI-2E family transporter [Virgibacillus halotolerans]MBM7601153.1 putative PurR-regulated permease PerM [Virgibacillus halotolerans]